MSASQNCVGRPSTIHRYGFMRPTKSMEHHFSNAEQDAVRCAFLPSSFIQIRKLPETLKAGSFGQGGIILSETSPRGLPRSAGRLWTGLPPPSRSGSPSRFSTPPSSSFVSALSFVAAHWQEKKEQAGHCPTRADDDDIIKNNIIPFLKTRHLLRK